MNLVQRGVLLVHLLVSFSAISCSGHDVSDIVGHDRVAGEGVVVEKLTADLPNLSQRIEEIRTAAVAGRSAIVSVDAVAKVLGETFHEEASGPGRFVSDNYRMQWIESKQLLEVRIAEGRITSLNAKVNEVDESYVRALGSRVLSEFGIPDDPEAVVIRRLMAQGHSANGAVQEPPVVVAWKLHLRGAIAGISVENRRVILSVRPDGVVEKIFVRWPTYAREEISGLLTLDSDIDTLFRRALLDEPMLLTGKSRAEYRFVIDNDTLRAAVLFRGFRPGLFEGSGKRATIVRVL